MKIRHPALIRALSRVGAVGIRAWIGTVRWREVALGPTVVPTTPGLRDCYIYAFWHENMLLPARLYGGLGVRVLVSQHADGQLITEIIRRLGYRAVRGSTTRGGVQAVRTMVSGSRDGHLVITPDGPRGPRREAKPGLVYVASRTGLPIVPTGVGYDRPCRAGSWDRFAVPRPFSRAVLVTDEPIVVPADAGRDELERFRRLVQDGLDRATEAAETWAVHGVPSDRASAQVPHRRSA